MERLKKCRECYWNEQCGRRYACEDFTPMEDEDDVAYYQDFLTERAEAYRLVEAMYKEESFP